MTTNRPAPSGAAWWWAFEELGEVPRLVDFLHRLSDWYVFQADDLPDAESVRLRLSDMADELTRCLRRHPKVPADAVFIADMDRFLRDLAEQDVPTWANLLYWVDAEHTQNDGLVDELLDHSGLACLPAKAALVGNELRLDGGGATAVGCQLQGPKIVVTVVVSEKTLAARAHEAVALRRLYDWCRATRHLVDGGLHEKTRTRLREASLQAEALGGECLVAAEFVWGEFLDQVQAGQGEARERFMTRLQAYLNVREDYESLLAAFEVGQVSDIEGLFAEVLLPR